MTRSSSVNVCETLVIVIPWMLPIIIASFGNDKEVMESIFKRLRYLAERSDENCRKMHDGDLDLILIDILIKRGESFDYYLMKIQ